jgi:galactokinase
VNLIGEHTDYNAGLALPFAIAEGVTVSARARRDGRVEAYALDLREHDDFVVAQPGPGEGWRAFVRGVVGELDRAGFVIPGAELEISGDLARGSGLSSSAALEVALCLALLGLLDTPRPDARALAYLCSRVEREWVGVHTGMLDQLASLCGEPEMALRIDFRDLRIEPVPLRLPAGWRLVVLDSGKSHVLAQSGYNERRAECAEACALLSVGSLREAQRGELEYLPPTLANRVEHVLAENERVLATAAALRAGDLHATGRLLNASHASLRDLYECSTPAIELAVERLHAAGAVGARMVGGGFGGHVLGLLPPGTQSPAGAHQVSPAGGAHLVEP